MAMCIQSDIQHAGVVVYPANIAGFSSIPRADMTPSAPVSLYNMTQGIIGIS